MRLFGEDIRVESVLDELFKLMGFELIGVMESVSLVNDVSNNLQLVKLGDILFLCGVLAITVEPRLHLIEGLNVLLSGLVFHVLSLVSILVEVSSVVIDIGLEEISGHLELNDFLICCVHVILELMEFRDLVAGESMLFKLEVDVGGSSLVNNLCLVLLLRGWGSLGGCLAFFSWSRSGSRRCLDWNLLFFLVLFNELSSVKRRNLVLVKFDSEFERVLFMLVLRNNDVVSSEHLWNAIDNV